MPIKKDKDSDANLSVEELFSSLIANDRSNNQREPFKFLDPYSVNDRDLFFGRDDEIAEIYRAFYKSRLLLIYGESGSGKTSLVQCGLASEIPPEDSKFFTVRCALDPLDAVARELESKTNFGDDEVPTDLMDLLQEVAQRHSKTVVVVFDQFEELFIFHPQSVWGAVAKELERWLASEVDVRVVLSIRQEFFAQLTELERTLPSLYDNRFWVRRMTAHQARKVITGPCKRLSIPVEDGLVDDLIQDLSRDGKGVELPILQVVLDRLYRDAVAKKPEKPELSRRAYEDLGKVVSILERFIEDRVHNSEQPERVRQVLKALVTSEGTKRVSSKNDIRSNAAPFGPPLDDDTLAVILQQLVDDRILREDSDHHLFELRHDALAATIHSWLTGLEKEILDVRSSLENRAKEFVARNRSDNALLGADFIEYLEPYMRHLNLDGELLDLVQQSRAHVKKSTTRHRRLRLTFATTLIIVLGLLSTVATFNWLEADKKNDEARQALLKAEENEQKANEANTTLEEEQADFGTFIESVLDSSNQSLTPIGILLDSEKQGLLLRVYNSSESGPTDDANSGDMQSLLTSAVIDALLDSGALTQFDGQYNRFTKKFINSDRFEQLLERSIISTTNPKGEEGQSADNSAVDGSADVNSNVLEHLSKLVSQGNYADVQHVLSQPEILQETTSAAPEQIANPVINLALGSYYYNLNQMDLAQNHLYDFALHWLEDGIPCHTEDNLCDQLWPALFALNTIYKNAGNGEIEKLHADLWKVDLNNASHRLVRDELSWTFALTKYLHGEHMSAAAIADQMTNSHYLEQKVAGTTLHILASMKTRNSAEIAKHSFNAKITSPAWPVVLDSNLLSGLNNDLYVVAIPGAGMTCEQIKSTGIKECYEKTAGEYVGLSNSHDLSVMALYRQAFFYHQSKRFEESADAIQMIMTAPIGRSLGALCDMINDVYSIEPTTCALIDNKHETERMLQSSQSLESVTEELVPHFDELSDYADASFFQALQIATANRVSSDIPDKPTGCDHVVLSRLNKKELGIARNMVFARHGFMFGKLDLKMYFAEQDWYQPTALYNADLLTKDDYACIKRVKFWEAKMNEKAPLAEQYSVLAWYQILNGQFDQALETTNQGLEKDPDLAVLVAYKAHALWLMGESKKALGMYAHNIGQNDSTRSWKDIVQENLMTLSKVGIAIGDQRPIDEAISVPIHFDCTTADYHVLIDGGGPQGSPRYKAWKAGVPMMDPQSKLVVGGELKSVEMDGCDRTFWSFPTDSGYEYRVGEGVACFDAPKEAIGVLQVYKPDPMTDQKAGKSSKKSKGKSKAPNKIKKADEQWCFP